MAGRYRSTVPDAAHRRLPVIGLRQRRSRDRRHGSEPAVNGEIGLARGSLEAFATGTVLRPLDLTVTAAQNEWRLTRLEARDGGNGTHSPRAWSPWPTPPGGAGSIAATSPPALAILVSTLNGALSADGAIGERLLVSGRIENEQTEIRLVNRLPPSIVTVDVVQGRIAIQGAGRRCRSRNRARLIFSI